MQWLKERGSGADGGHVWTSLTPAGETDPIYLRGRGVEESLTRESKVGGTEPEGAFTLNIQYRGHVQDVAKERN